MRGFPDVDRARIDMSAFPVRRRENRMALKVLLIQSDTRAAQPLARYFKHRGDEVWQAWELGQAQALLEQTRPNLLLMDLHIPHQDWVTFLRNAVAFIPGLKVIMTNKYPDLQREMTARELGVQVFLRQPFSQHWIDQAVGRLDEKTRPIHKTPASAVQQQVRMPVRVKITLPYLLLAMLFALGSAYLISRIVLESIQDRFLNQLVATGKQSQDWVVTEENRLLETLRLVSNTQGVSDAIQAGNSETLRLYSLPLAANAADEEVVLLDMQGNDLLTLTHVADGGPSDYQSTRGNPAYAQLDFVKRALAGEKDTSGDKFIGRGSSVLGEMLYVSGPVMDAAGKQVGVVLVGKSLRTLVRQVSQETLSRVSFYNLQGQVIASSLYDSTNTAPITQAQVVETLTSQNSSSLTRDVAVSTVNYTEILGPWNVRGGTNLGVIGSSLAQAFLAHASQTTQIEIFVLAVAAILLVIFTGLFLANIITRPLMRLVNASSEVAQGNLEVKVDANGDDELAILARSFNYMVAGLQEGSIYRDLLGRTVSPEVREQLRQTFTSGNLRLEGQQAVATVLMTDIRGFTTLSEKEDPATIFQWLNEYFSQIVPGVTNCGGVVNKFDGDAMLAFFGTLPRLLNPKQSALSACLAAVEALKVIDTLNSQRRARGEPQLITGIGIHTGVVIAGGLGTSDRLHYTIIGDTVNTTQRLESLTRDLFDTSGILVSHATYSALSEHQSMFSFEPLGYHQVKGKQEKILVYRLMPFNPAEGKKAML
jgi:class 3 adenylate cyclase/CheY-like chemotaxis protein